MLIKLHQRIPLDFLLDEASCISLHQIPGSLVFPIDNLHGGLIAQALPSFSVGFGRKRLLFGIHPIQDVPLEHVLRIVPQVRIGYSYIVGHFQVSFVVRVRCPPLGTRSFPDLVKDVEALQAADFRSRRPRSMRTGRFKNLGRIGSLVVIKVPEILALANSHLL